MPELRSPATPSEEYGQETVRSERVATRLSRRLPIKGRAGDRLHAKLLSRRGDGVQHFSWGSRNATVIASSNCRC